MLQIDGVQYSLRPATGEDLPQILKIEEASFPMPWTKENFLEEQKKPFSHFLVLCDDETDSKVIAYVIFWKMFEEVHLITIAVDADYRGLGIATKLLDKVVQASLKLDAKRIFLEVRKSNNAAIQLYQKRKFFIDHMKKNFYQDGEDAYFMQLFLTKPTSEKV